MNNQTFQALSTFEQVEFLSDLLGESCFEVAAIKYQSMSETQQMRVKTNFYNYLNSYSLTITDAIVKEAETTYAGSPMAFMLRQYGYTITTTSKFTEAAKSLTEGRKVTLIKFSEFGFPVLINTVIDRVEIKPYAQYSESLKIIHKPKKKRSLYSNIILPYQELLVYDGWIDTDIKKLSHVTLRENEHASVQQSKYCSFDKQFISDILATIKEQPIAHIQ